MSNIKELLPVANTAQIIDTISEQVEDQKFLWKQNPSIEVSPKMSHQEVFDILNQLPKFQNFIHRAVYLSYCPPDEWNNFKSRVVGFSNELVAENILRTEYNRSGSILLDSHHAKPVILAMFPDAQVENYGAPYGYDSNQIYRIDKYGKKIHLPSPDCMLVDNKGNLRFFAETSLRTDIRYWDDKYDKYMYMIDYFTSYNDTRRIFSDCHSHFVVTPKMFNKRNVLIKNKEKGDYIDFTPLPYKRDQIHEFIETYIPKEPQHRQNQNTAQELPHWSTFLEPSALVAPII